MRNGKAHPFLPTRRKNKAGVEHSAPVCAGRGLNPRPERYTPAKYLPAIPNPERHPPAMNLLIGCCFL